MANAAETRQIETPGSAPAGPALSYGRQSISDSDIAAVTAVLRGDWLTGGPAVPAFEAAVAALVGSRHAVACANGTAALHLAVLAAGLRHGTTAIVPSLTFLATASCAVLAGAEVAFADVDAATGLLTPALLEAAIARVAAAGMPPPRAVLPVHLAGQTCDMDGIGAVARRHGLVVIEDACHALGSIGTGTSAPADPVGSCRAGAMAAFSFHPVKTVTTGEGGMVTCNDDALAAHLRLLRNHGMNRDPAAFTETAQAFAADGTANPWYYEMAEPGLNYRLDDIACALGLSQLARLPAFAARRRALAARYDGLLAPLAPLVRPLARVPWCRPVLHLYVAHIDFAAAGLDRAAMMGRLRERGIGTQVHYLPVHRQPYWRGLGEVVLPGADAYYESCLSLPLYPDMTDDDPARVVAALAAALGAGKMNFAIAGRPIGPGHPPYVIAELSGNHNGDLGRALALIDAAHAAGAHAVKLQTYTADTMTIDHHGPGFDLEEGLWKGRSLYELYQEAHTPWEWHGALFERGRALGMAVFSTPFDPSAVAFLESLDAPAYKIASFELLDLPLIEEVARRGKPMIVSTGMATDAEIAEALAAIRAAGDPPVVVLHCVSGYPTPAAEINLRRIPHLAAIFGVAVGLSDHTLGTAVAIAATALGIVAVEKHFTLARADGGPDAAFSLEPPELAELVTGTATAWAALGAPAAAIRPSERASLAYRRSLYVVADVARGQPLTPANLRAIRPGFGLPPKHLPAVLGRRAGRDLTRGTPLAWDDLLPDPPGSH